MVVTEINAGIGSNKYPDHSGNISERLPVDMAVRKVCLYESTSVFFRYYFNAASCNLGGTLAR